MIVVLDVGNTNLALAVVRGTDVSVARRAETRPSATVEEMEATLDALLNEDGAALSDVDEMAFVSVVPSVTTRVREISERRHFPLLVADWTNLGMPIRVDDPSGVGADRLVNGLAALRLYGAPAIVVDLGTATTFDVVAADGAFVGGAIAPGIGLGLEGLAGGTAQLPRAILALPDKPIGSDTISAIQSGTVLGHVGLVTFLVRAIGAQLAIDGGPAAKVVLTGGLSATPWAAAIPGVDAIDPLLTLRGLAILHADSRQPARVDA